jgi:glycogen debranching enzyme
LWHEASSQYCSRDVTTGALITEPTIATFLSLWAGLRPDRMRRVTDRLAADGWRLPHPVPSVPADSPQFEVDRYWKGPTWINTNWLIIQGLREQGATAVAAELRDQTLALVRDGGCAEYFNPQTGAAHGAREFSWTAALVLDLLV